MSHTLSPTAPEPVSERDAAWFEELVPAVARARAGVLARRHPDGHWLGEDGSDSSHEAEFVLLLAVLGKRDDPRVRLAANRLVVLQRSDGGWANGPGPADLGASVRAYLALKIAGHAANEPHVTRAAEAIRSLGGAGAVDVLTRFYLALLGQIPYSACPPVPVERVLVPRRFRSGLDALAAWQRTVLVPLSVVDAHKPVTKLPESMHVRELFVAPPEPALRLSVRARVARGLERWGLTPLRRRAVRGAVNWMRERYADSDGLGASFVPMALNAIALKCLGVSDADAEARWVMNQLENLCATDGAALRVRSRLTPVRDTARALVAVADARRAGAAPECEAAVRWLLDREVRRAGDWARTVRGVEPGGWSFAYRNGFYPDTESTALVLLALAHSEHAMREACAGPVHRALNWLLAMQNRDGGWAAFDRDVSADPSCPVGSARVLEALGHFGFRTGQPPVDAAVRFVLARQEESGAWLDRGDGSSGCWSVLAGLRAVGFDVTLPVARRAVRWLKAAQNADGGWGGPGTGDAPSTARALLGLLAAGEAEGPEVRAGAEFLVGTQRADGGWSGAGEHLPLTALARYCAAIGPRLAVPAAGPRVDPGHGPSGPHGSRFTNSR